MTTLLWDDADIDELLLGSPAQEETKARKAVLQQQWQALHDSAFSKDPARFPPGKLQAGEALCLCSAIASESPAVVWTIRADIHP